MSGSISSNILLQTEMLKAVDGVAKSNGSDVGGTWLQLMCCAFLNVCVPNLPQG